MDLLEAIQQRPENAVDCRRIHSPVTAEMLLDRDALQQFHHDVGGAVGFDEVEDLHDPGGFVQGGERAPFRAETLASPGEFVRNLGRARRNGAGILAEGQHRWQELLYGDLPVELKVARAVSDPEAALSQHRQNFVATDAGTLRKRCSIAAGSSWLPPWPLGPRFDHVTPASSSAPDHDARSMGREEVWPPATTFGRP